MLISKFRNSDELLNIKEFETRLNINLPQQYIIFMQKYNGGETPDTIWSGKGKCDIRGFYGINTSNRNWDIEENLKYNRYNELLLQKMIPIAENSFCDLFCINCMDGSIWLTYHDSDKKIQIANEFNEFVAKCKSKRIGHISTIEERKERLFANGHGDKLSDAMVRGWQAEIDKYANIVQEEVELTSV